LAALLHRSRVEQRLPLIFVKALSLGFQVELQSEWLLANPLSAAALADESMNWQRIGSVFRVKRRAPVPVLA
jgi:exopolyphosphatase/guanosine-5'-triphosphate,3'-diphosphate pyrophosphatase